MQCSMRPLTVNTIEVMGDRLCVVAWSAQQCTVGSISIAQFITAPSVSRKKDAPVLCDRKAAHHALVEVFDHAVGEDHIIAYDEVSSTCGSLNFLQKQGANTVQNV